MRNVNLIFFKSFQLMFLIVIVCLSSNTLIAQSTLIDPAGDGGFETGATFAANNWTAVNSTTDRWVTNAPTTSTTGSFDGARCAFVSTSAAGTTIIYSQTSVIQHLYYTVTVPSTGNLTLDFKYIAGGEGTQFTNDWDNLKVFFVPSTAPTADYTPVANTAINNNFRIGNTFYNLTGATWTTPSQVTLSGVCSGTYRLIFSWKSDGSTIANPSASLDNINLIHTVAAQRIASAGGTFTIDNALANSGNNFTTFSEAINALNNVCGGLSSAVTFNVTAGQTFPENPPALTATGTLTNQIIFQKSGLGANPKITPTGTAGSTDFGFCISGGDYISINGVDIDASAGSAVEYGYLVRNVSATDGAQNNTIQNVSINLGTRAGSNSSYGILQTATSTGGGFTPTNATGANSGNKYHNLTISNIRNNGIYLLGNGSVRDIACEIGTNVCNNRNTIANIGPTVSTSIGAYGIQTVSQENCKIFNTDISVIAGNQSASYGVYMTTNNGNCELYNNRCENISVFGSSTTTGVSYGLRADQSTTGTHNSRIYNNVVSNLFTSRTSASATRYVFGIWVGNTSATSTQSYDIDNNSVSIGQGMNIAISSACLEVQNNGSVYRIRGNIFANFTASQGVTAKHYAVRFTGATWGATGSVCNFNNYYIANDLNTSGFISLVNTANNATLAAHQAALTSPGTQDVNSLNSDPQFVNNNNDLHSSASTLNAVLSFTTQAWVTTDIECADRSTASPSDLGAYVINTCSVADGGTITPATQNKCIGQNATMTSTGATTGSGITYQWKVSLTSGSGYANVTGGSGANTTSYTTDALTAGTYYYVLETTCSAGPTSDFSNELTVTVNALPTVTVSPTSGSLCQPGASPITLTGGGASTYAWSPATGLSATTGTMVDASPSSTQAYVVTGTDVNGCTNTAMSTITVTATPATPTTAGYSICLNGTIPGGQGLTSTSVGSSVLTGSQTINFDVAAQPTETNSAPGNIVASATMAALPAGSTVTSIVIAYSGLTALVNSYRSEINLGLSGALINSASADPLAPGSAGLLNYSRTASTGITATIGGGTVNLLYWDSSNDNAGAEATFPTGTSVASVTVNYSYPSPTAIAWYDAVSGGNFIGNGSPFDPIGVDPALPNSSVAGLYTYYAQINNGACPSLRTPAILTIGSTPSAIASATQSNICIGSSTSLTATPSGASPFTYLWNDPTAATTQTVSVSPTSNTTYTVTVTDACSSATTATVTINVDAPNVGSPLATSVCGSGTSTLSTTGNSGTIKWYDAASGGNLVGTGTPVVSPIINSATTYYVEAQNIGASSNGARIAPTSTSTTTPSSFGLVFTATSSFLLNSVDVYPSNTGTITVQLQNSSGTPLQTQTFTVSTGSTTVPVSLLFTNGWPVSAGIDYRLLATSGTLSPVRESSLGGFPYTLPGVGSVTNGYLSGTSTTYYYFYNWNYSTVCSSSRTSVVVPYSTAPTAGTATATPNIICEGSSTSLNLSGADPSYTTFNWSNGAGPGLPVSVSPLITTTYTVTATDGVCSSSSTVIVTVNPKPTITSTTATPSLVCLGGNSQLSSIIPTDVTKYAFAGSTSTYNIITGTSVTFGSIDDGYVGDLPIGFTFNYENVGSTLFGVSPNGWIRLDQTGSASTGGFTNGLANVSNTKYLAPLWDDNNMTGGTVIYTTSGSPGSRILTVQWTNMHVGGSGSSSNPTISMQVNLHEANGVIEFIYDSTSGALSSTTASIGISGGANTKYLSVTPLTPSNLSTVSSLVENTSISSASNFPSGTKYTFTPPLFTYLWSPNTFLNMDNIYNPLASLVTANTSYVVTVTDQNNCSNTGSVSVNIATTAAVTSSADSGAGSLRAAIDCVADGGTVTNASITSMMTDPIFINKNVIISGTGTASIDFDFAASGLSTGTFGLQIAAGKTVTLNNLNIVDRANPDMSSPSIKPVIDLMTGNPGGNLIINGSTTISKQ